MARKYELHKKDTGSGARVSYTTKTVKGHPYVEATVCKYGWPRKRFTGGTKKAVENKVEEYLVALRNEGGEAVHLTGEAKRDAMKARSALGEGEALADAVRELQDVRGKLVPGESLPDAVRELVDCRRLLNLLDSDGQPVMDADAIRDAVKGAVVEFAKARAELGGRATVLEAAAFWIKHHPDGAVVTVGQMADDFLAEQERRGNSPAHRKILAQRMRALVSEFGEGRSVADFMPEDLETFIYGREGLSVQSRNAWIITVKSAFKFAFKRYGLAANPAERLKKGKVAKGTPEFTGVEDVEKLLRAAEIIATRTGKKWVAVAAALLFFSGVRPSELVGQYKLKGEGENGEVKGGLTWENIVVNEGFIRLTAKVTKTTQARMVQMSGNLLAWIGRYGGQGEGRIVPNPTAWKRVREELEKLAGVKWGQDYARHAFATYHLAAFNDRGRLETEMGHGQTSTQLETAYRGLATAAEAARFWSIMPTGQVKVKKAGEK